MMRPLFVGMVAGMLITFGWATWLPLPGKPNRRGLSVVFFLLAILLSLAACHADPTGPVAHRSITIPGEEVRQ